MGLDFYKKWEYTGIVEAKKAGDLIVIRLSFFLRQVVLIN